VFRYILSLTFAAGFASAATISTSASCDGVTTVGTFGASCNDGLYMAFASIDAPSFVDTRIGQFPAFSVNVDVSGNLPGSGVATASFSDDYVFTIFGGTGNGSFCPVINTNHGSGASAGMTFAGIRTEDCFIPFIGRVPFTFGVPQIISIDMGARASGVGALSGGASASLQSLSPISFFDPAGNPLSNVTFTLVEVPEPTAVSLLSLGLFFLAVAIRRMRFSWTH
jgi:hypothetical protein